MNNECGCWLNCARHTRSPNERTMEMAPGVMLWHIPRVQISQQWLWPLRQSSGTAQKDNNSNPIRQLNWDTTTVHPSRPRKLAAHKVKKPCVETTVTLDVLSDMLVISSDKDDLTYETLENSDSETEVSIASEWPNELHLSDSIEMLPLNAEVHLIFIFIIPALTCF